MSLIKQAEPEAGGATAKLLEYLDSPYTGGALGALGGATAAALATGSRRDENARQRTLRTIRNAVAAGLVGGAGGYLAQKGLGATAEVVLGDGTEVTEKPGVMRSPLGRLLAPAAIHAKSRWGAGNRRADTLGAEFRGVGTANVGGTPVSFNPPEGYVGSYADYFRKEVSPQIERMARDPVKWDLAVRQGYLFNGFNAQGQRGSATGNGPEVKAWLNSAYGQGKRQIAMRHLFPGSSHLATTGNWRSGRIGGRLGGSALMLASLALPDLGAYLTRSGSDAAGTAFSDYMTMGGGKPAESGNILLRGFNPFAGKKEE